MVSSNLVLLLIPIPVLLKLQIPSPRKPILLFLFSSAIFVIICTILRTYYSLKILSTLSIALGCADRDCFVVVIVASLPGIRPLFRNTRWIRLVKSGPYDKQTVIRSSRVFPTEAPRQ
jgi:hypothetical protein